MDKLRRFLNNTPPEFIQEFLNSFTTHGWDEIDWTSRPRKRTDQIESAIRSHIAKTSAEIQVTVDQIEKIADEKGRRSLRDVLKSDEHDLDEFDTLPDPRACAVWLRGIAPALFERALQIDYADRTRSPRKWSGYKLRHSGIEDDVSDLRRTMFHGALAEILAKDGGNGRIHIEWQDRVKHGAGTSDTRECLQVTIFREAAPRSEAAFSSVGALEYGIRRPVIEGALVYEPETGAIDVVTAGGKKVREEVANAFAINALGCEPEMDLIEARLLDLSSLSGWRQFEIRDEDGVEAVEVSKLHLSSPGSDPLFVMVQSGGPGPIDEGALYARMARLIGGPVLGQRPGWRVIFAELRITFRPEQGSSRSKSLRVELGLPNRTNLRENTERERLVANVLLDRWGIYAQPETGDDNA